MNNLHTSKPFLKWPGGKYRLTNRINKKLGQGKRLVEPFVGSAAVFLNTDYQDYLLADTNQDLINLYLHLQSEGLVFVEYCKTFFTKKNNNEGKYYKFREEFNASTESRLKSALFLYLNRHCYNGLCRYNSKGIFNTPFGRYSRPYFPQNEMLNFFHKAKNAEFICASFSDTIRRITKHDVVYCDPPYVPLSKTANFTDYSAGGFNWKDQIALADWASRLATKGIQVVISNHNTPTTRELYLKAGATMENFKVRRTISCNPDKRNPVGELLAVFG
ncbi:MAG: Dam family site-specific DNA-(adenine-N6)-methyltransferase [Proteobacteria bacterium]|nr:Dam family site-specific DNA-(adenine-N6)-methyltransferase [Pseudomonadota bacterium]